MTGSDLKKIHYRVAKYSALVAPPAVLLCVMASINPATQLVRDFQSVSFGTSPQLSQRMLASENMPTYYPSTIPEARSEDFWLGRVLNKDEFAPVAWNAPVSVGDHIRIRDSHSQERTFIVLAVREALNPVSNINAPTKIVSEELGETDYIVTCQDPHNKKPSLIEFRINANGRGLNVLRLEHQAL